ncbi:hsp70 family protein [Anaeramoeba flamelloides]|uniref:Hsp70 family protein n=1 Tax=Anaeramoeba flamelloides TaxID=1746091 RepID=A0AAV7Y2G6_9EUKA|nr:hsp70 family protein [Anaeramoeba flamelloides]
MSEKEKIVIGIDFGTSRSGFAYSFIGDKEQQIYGNNDWKDFKTDSAILLKKDKNGDCRGGANLIEIVEFGQEAIRKYVEMLEEEEGELYELFRYYKMALYKSRTFVKSVSGSVFKLVDVIAMSLQWIKDTALQHINLTVRTPIETDQVRWVLTVPAIWSEKAKHFMRMCAHRGGLVDNEESEHLLLIHEPEAAAIEGFFSANPIVSEEVFESGKVLILDAGSGTIDITVLEIDRSQRENSDKIKVIIPAKGGSDGSNTIDKNFVTFLKKFLGTDDFESNPDFIDLFQKWIEEKHRVKLDYKKATTPIRFTIQESLSGETPVEELVQKWNEGKEKTDQTFIKSGMLNKRSIKLSKAFLASLFDKPVNNVLQNIEKVFNKYQQTLHDVKDILMVGSYSNSDILYHAVKKKFEDDPYNLTVLVGTNPGRAIVFGAVRYGLNPNILSSRTYEYNYGLLWYPRFEEEKHKQSKKISKGNYWLCKDVFKLLVEKDVAIKVDYVKPQEFISMGRDLTLEIYRTKRELDPNVVYYIDEDGFEFFGSTIIRNIQSENDQPVGITIEFKFGGTMIKVGVVNKENNMAFPGTIVYKEKNI